MRKLSCFALVGALMLSGCAATPATQETEAPTATTAPTAADATFEGIRTLDDAIAYAKGIYPSQDDVAGEIARTSRKLGDLVANSDLPWDVHNKVGQQLIDLNASVANHPEQAHLDLLTLQDIANEIAAAR